MKQFFSIKYINPDPAGGEGLSHATGNTGFSNGITRLHIALSPDDQFALHPAYNRDRGPVNIIGLRTRVAF